MLLAEDQLFSFVLDHCGEILYHLRANNFAHGKLTRRIDDMMAKIEGFYDEDASAFIKELTNRLAFRASVESYFLYMQGMRDGTKCQQFMGLEIVDRYYAAHLDEGIPDMFD